MGTGREAVRITPDLEGGTRPTDTPGPVGATTGEARRREVQGRGTSLAEEGEVGEVVVLVVLAGQITVTGERRTVTGIAERTREGVTPALMVTPMVTPMVTLMVTPPEAMVILPTAMVILPMDMVTRLMVTVALMEEEMPGLVNPPRPSELVAATTLTRFRVWTRTGLTVVESLVTEELWPSKPDRC